MLRTSFPWQLAGAISQFISSLRALPVWPPYAGLLASSVLLLSPAAGEEQSEIVHARTGPWSVAANPGYPYGVTNGRLAPVKFSVEEGTTVTVESTGIASAYGTNFSTYMGPAGYYYKGGHWDSFVPANNKLGSSGTRFPSYYTAPSWPTALLAVMGTFANDNGVIIGQPFEIASRARKEVPEGATYLQVGVNDDAFQDNSGGFEVRVRADKFVFGRLTDPSQAANPNGGADEPLAPKASAEMLDGLEEFEGGWVADGVTPWIMGLQGAEPESEVTFSFEIEYGQVLHRTMGQRLRVLSGTTWQPSTTATVSGDGKCHLYLEAMAADDLLLEASTEMTITVHAEGDGFETSSSFQIRKPPVALVHGYNTAGDWGMPYAAGNLGRQREFVKTIRYGVSVASNGTLDFTQNKFWPLHTCAAALSTELDAWLVDSELHKQWAFTRYDAVGHSQGGVLLRMLATGKQNPGIPAYKNSSNFNRGRFHRVITIGSPHNGTRLVRYLQSMYGRPSYFAIFPNLMTTADLLGLGSSLNGTLQGKFDPWGQQIRELNSPTGRWLPDNDAKFFMIRTTIGGGESPGKDSTNLIPSYFSIGLAIADDTSVLPKGSDGVVDLDSQGYAGNVGNVFDIVGPDISHSAPLPVFLAGEYQTSSQEVATKVREALDGGATFGRFSVPPLLPNSVRDLIDAKVDRLVRGPDLEKLLPGGGNEPPPEPDPIEPQTVHYRLNPLPAAPLQGTVQWSTALYGFGGVSYWMVEVVVDPEDSTKANVTVPPGLTGDLVLYAQYATADDRMVVTPPAIVSSIPPAGTLVFTAIELDQSSGSLPAGAKIPLNVWAMYSNGARRLLFPDPAAVVFTSLSPATAEVTPEGMVTLTSPGAATIRASYGGMTALAHFTATAPVNSPEITIPSGWSAVPGEAFAYQVIATNAPDSYSATGLPTGLAIHPATGLISGKPVAAGTYNVAIEVANTAGIASTTFTLDVARSPANWRQLHFQSPSNSGDGADLADPDSDGLANLIEFAFALDPKRGTSLQLPQAQRIGGNLVISFTAPAGTTGVTYSAQWSNSLSSGSWQPVPDTGSGNLHTFSVPMTGRDEMFLRLVVTSP